MGVGQVYYTRARENIFPGKSLKRASAASYLSRRASLGGVFFSPFFFSLFWQHVQLYQNVPWGFGFFCCCCFLAPCQFSYFIHGISITGSRRQLQCWPDTRSLLTFPGTSSAIAPKPCYLSKLTPCAERKRASGPLV